MKPMLLLISVILIFPFVATSQTVTDYDGNVYPTVQIGSQIWMAKNLQTTHYADGTELIDGNSVGAIWGDFTSKYWFRFGDTAQLNPYGALYTWAAAMNGSSSINESPGVQGVCPTGWHLPYKSEWETMINYLGGFSVAGGKLKDTLNWGTQNIGATNETGFSAIPAGMRNPVHLYQYFGEFTYMWTSTEANASNAYSTGLYWFAQIADTNVTQYKESGISVRCIKNGGGSSINYNKNTEMYQVYPTQAKENIYLKGNLEGIKIIIVSLNGIVSEQNSISGGAVDISNLSRGMYLVGFYKNNQLIAIQKFNKI